MTIINLTPHIVRLNDGREFPPSGTVARVDSWHTEPDERGVCRVEYGAVTGVPGPVADTLYIVSGLVAGRLPDREDVVSPATGHPDAVRRNGQPYSVPCWCKAS